MMYARLLGSCVTSIGLSLLCASGALAQQPAGQGKQTSGTPASASTDTPAGATLSSQSGDTGLWVVPTANVLPDRKWSLSFYRTNQDDGQGFSDVSNFPANVAFGLKNRAEIFGSWTVVTRIDRDSRPLFFSSTTQAASTGTGGGLLVNYPLDHTNWFGNGRGDLRLGTKLNLLSGRNGPFDAAVRVIVKLPVGNDTLGASSGKTDFSFHGIVSKRTPIAVLSVYAGPLFRGNPAGYQLTNGLEWGVGAGFPDQHSLGIHFTAELYGEKYFNNTISAPAGLLGTDGSAVPTSTDIKSPVFADIGLTWQAPNGFFIGASASRNMHMESRTDAQAVSAITFADHSLDKSGFEVRLGYYPGARRHVPPPPPPPAPPAPPTPTPPTPTAPTNRPPTVKAMCDPCTVEVGKTSTVSADAQDPDGDPLTYRWSAPAGTFSSPTSRQTPWTAPMTVGPVATTVTVDDGHGHTASDSVTIQVIKPVEKAIVFEDVYFDFDRSALRPEAQRILDDAVAEMNQNPTLQITIEGYTCNIGTAEYNLALGERRAKAVRDYLVGKGVSADRLRTVSFGEERPKYDNSREETRRLNRRAALVVRLSGFEQ